MNKKEAFLILHIPADGESEQQFQCENDFSRLKNIAFVSMNVVLIAVYFYIV